MKINVSTLGKKPQKAAPFVGLETIKFGLNFPMLLVFPKLHFLARFAMTWMCLMCMQVEVEVSRTSVSPCKIGGPVLQLPKAIHCQF